MDEATKRAFEIGEHVSAIFKIIQTDPEWSAGNAVSFGVPDMAGGMIDLYMRHSPAPENPDFGVAMTEEWLIENKGREFTEALHVAHCAGCAVTLRADRDMPEGLRMLCLECMENDDITARLMAKPN